MSPSPCPFKLFRVEIVRRPMRFRCEYLHLPTRGRIIFTVALPGIEPGPFLPEALARRAGAQWIEAGGLDPHDCVFLSVVEVTDKMSVPGVA